MKKTAKEKKFPFEIGVRVRLVKYIRGSESVKFVGKIGTVSKIAPHQPHLADVKFDEHIGGTDTIVCSGDMLESAALHESVSTTEEIITFEHPQTGKDIQIVFPEMKPEPERGTESDVRLEDLVMLLRRAVVRFRAIDDHKGNVLADSIMDYLRRKGLADGTSILREIPSPLPVREQSDADELLAEVMHLWIDGYISKNPNSCADASISNETFAKISAHLDNVGFEVDYFGWHRRAIAGEKEE